MKELGKIKLKNLSFEKAKTVMQLINPGMVMVDAWDFGEFYGFRFAKWEKDFGEYSKKKALEKFTWYGYDAIHKKTGKRRDITTAQTMFMDDPIEIPIE